MIVQSPPPAPRATSPEAACRSLIEPAPSAAPSRLKRRAVAAATAAPANTAPHEMRLRLPQLASEPSPDHPSVALIKDMTASVLRNTHRLEWTALLGAAACLILRRVTTAQPSGSHDVILDAAITEAAL